MKFLAIFVQIFLLVNSTGDCGKFNWIELDLTHNPMGNPKEKKCIDHWCKDIEGSCAIESQDKTLCTGKYKVYWIRKCNIWEKEKRMGCSGLQCHSKINKVLPHKGKARRGKTYLAQNGGKHFLVEAENPEKGSKSGDIQLGTIKHKAQKELEIEVADDEGAGVKQMKEVFRTPAQKSSGTTLSNGTRDVQSQNSSGTSHIEFEELRHNLNLPMTTPLVAHKQINNSFGTAPSLRVEVAQDQGHGASSKDKAPDQGPTEITIKAQVTDSFYNKEDFAIYLNNK